MLATAQTMCLKWTIKFSYSYSYYYMRTGMEINIPADIDNDILDKVINAEKSGFPITKSQFC